MKKDTKEYTPFGKKVAKALIDLDLNNKELAEAIGITPAYLTDILKGRRPGNKQKVIICKLLSIESDI